jgi:hypothetical protein
MRPISSRIEYIYREYYYEKARARHHALIQYADLFLKNLPIYNKCNCRVDFQKMVALVDSYFLDVIRFKEYHFQPKLPNGTVDVFSKDWMDYVHREKLLHPSKVGALLSKWILKYSPIIIIPKSEELISQDDAKIICSANAGFALNFSLSSMGVSQEDIDKETASDVLYHFRFRNYEDRSFFLIYNSVMKLASQGIDTSSAVDQIAGHATSIATHFSEKPDKSMTRRGDGKTYSMFLASAEDCDGLRDSVIKVVDEVNRSISGNINKFNLFDWRTDKSPGHQAGLFQENVFKDAVAKWQKESCDILVMLLWYKFGSGTAQEYDYYINRAKDHQPDGMAPLLLCCHYAGNVPRENLEGARVDDLISWIKARHSDWAEISPVRNSIKRRREFEDKFRDKLNWFLNQSV